MPVSIPRVHTPADDSLACWNSSWKSVRLLKPAGRKYMRPISMQYIKDAEMPQWCGYWHDLNIKLKMPNLHPQCLRCKHSTNTNYIWKVGDKRKSKTHSGNSQMKWLLLDSAFILSLTENILIKSHLLDAKRQKKKTVNIDAWSGTWVRSHLAMWWM